MAVWLLSTQGRDGHPRVVLAKALASNYLVRNNHPSLRRKFMFEPGRSLLRNQSSRKHHSA
jgi:hypothetical protein